MHFSPALRLAGAAKKFSPKSEKYADGFPGHAAGVRKIFPFL
jgi:hypothetical protein